MKSRYARPFSKISHAVFWWSVSLSDCLYSSSHPRLSHFSPSKIDCTEASVLRSTSVSSRRSTMVPAFRRAYNQLKMKVRALPTCKKPVGEGAKRTRGPELDKSSFLMGIEEFDMEDSWYGLAESSVKHPRHSRSKTRRFPEVASFHTPCTEIVLSLRACL